METMQRVGLGMFLLFLGVAAGQDLKSRSVAIRVYIVFGIAAVIWNLMMVLKLADTVNGAELGRICMERAVSSGIGLGLLLLGRACRGSIGAGDGCFFLVSGLLLDAGQNLWLLCGGIFLCGIVSLGILVRAQLAGVRNKGKDTLAFLPFVAAAGAAGLAAGVIRI